MPTYMHTFPNVVYEKVAALHGEDREWEFGWCAHAARMLGHQVDFRGNDAQAENLQVLGRLGAKMVPK